MFKEKLKVAKDNIKNNHKILFVLFVFVIVLTFFIISVCDDIANRSFSNNDDDLVETSNTSIVKRANGSSSSSYFDTNAYQLFTPSFTISYDMTFNSFVDYPSDWSSGKLCVYDFTSVKNSNLIYYSLVPSYWSRDSLYDLSIVFDTAISRKFAIIHKDYDYSFINSVPTSIYYTFGLSGISQLAPSYSLDNYLICSVSVSNSSMSVYCFNGSFAICDGLASSSSDYVSSFTLTLGFCKWSDLLNGSYSEGYETGKTEGYETGKTEGYQQGYQEGTLNSGNFTSILKDSTTQIMNITNDELSSQDSFSTWFDSSSSNTISSLQQNLSTLWSEVGYTDSSSDLFRWKIYLPFEIPISLFYFTFNNIDTSNIIINFYSSSDLSRAISYRLQDFTDNAFTIENPFTFSLVEFVASPNDFSSSSSITFVNQQYYLGYNDGYDVGLNNGKTEGYNEGYNSGKTDGYNEGYNVGFDKAASDNNVIGNALLSIGSIPFVIISDFLNFEILGFNLLSFITGIITLGLAIWLIKKIF